MKKLLYILLGAIIAIPTIAWGVNISVPQATSFGQLLRGNANGTYTPVATSTLGIPGNPDFTYNTDIGFGLTGSATGTKTHFTAGIHASGTSQLGTASSTMQTIADALWLPFHTSALLLSDAAGKIAEYTGTTCTNQFVRALSALGVATCESVNLASDVTGTLDISASTNLAATYPLVLTGDTLSTQLASTTIAQTYGTNQIGAITFATTSDTNLGLNITNTNGAFTFTSAWLGTLANARLTNSSVSYGGVAVSLGASDATPAFNLADATGLPISTGVSGLGSNVATWLATPSSANFASAVTGETGTGAVVFDTAPTFITGITTPIVTGTSYSATTTLPHASTTDLRVNGNLDLWGTVSATFSAFVAKIEAIFITNSHTYTGGTVQDFSAATVVQHKYPSFAYSTSTPWTASTTIPLGVARVNETWSNTSCFTSVGTLNAQFYYIQTGSTQVKMNMLAITTATTSQSFSSNNAIPAGSKRFAEIGTPASSPTYITCTPDIIQNQ